MRKNLKQIQKYLRWSTIPSGHEIQGLVLELVPRVIDLASTDRTTALGVSTMNVSSKGLITGYHEELCTFVDNVKHSISSLKDCGHYSIETFLTSVLSGKLNKQLLESWLKYSRGVKGVPDVKADVKVDATKCNKAPVHLVVPQREFKKSCQLCG